MAATLDLKRELHELYTAGTEPALVEVPELLALCADGSGAPNVAPAYAAAIEALYGLSYTARFALKAQGLTYRVMPLECLWWVPDMSEFASAARSDWRWTLMIVQPAQVTPELVERARADVIRRRSGGPTGSVQLRRLCEGEAAQVMHTGPYESEGPTIERLHAFIAERGLEPAGKHHEIYLSDPRRVGAEKLRTIIRQPVRPRGHRAE